jgi:hypothetical protein
LRAGKREEAVLSLGETWPNANELVVIAISKKQRKIEEFTLNRP